MLPPEAKKFNRSHDLCASGKVQGNGRDEEEA
jgi:hypothetical protein